MGVGVVPELGDERVALEGLLDDAALDARAPAVNETDVTESAIEGGADVVGHDRWDVARRERVQVELGLDRDADRVRIAHAAVYDAVTTVLMPPRTEKSPTTVMRLG